MFVSLSAYFGWLPGASEATVPMSRNGVVLHIYILTSSLRALLMSYRATDD